MTTAPMPRVSPPPSVAAVLGSLTGAGRIGQVDFAGPGPASTGSPSTGSPSTGSAPTAAAPTGSDATASEPTAAGPREPLTPADHDEPDAPSAAPCDEVPASQQHRPGPARKPARRPARRPAATAPERPTLTGDALGGGEPLTAESVDDLARLVVERMHDAELAMMTHLEAIEAEAARRCELLTAQAELDAELIRLHARREAHHILARARAGLAVGAQPVTEPAGVDSLTETLGRFADAVDELRPAKPGRTP